MCLRNASDAQETAQRLLWLSLLYTPARAQKRVWKRELQEWRKLLRTYGDLDKIRSCISTLQVSFEEVTMIAMEHTAIGLNCRGIHMPDWHLCERIPPVEDRFLLESLMWLYHPPWLQMMVWWKQHTHQRWTHDTLTPRDRISALWTIQDVLWKPSAYPLPMEILPNAAKAEQWLLRIASGETPVVVLDLPSRSISSARLKGPLRAYRCSSALRTRLLLATAQWCITWSRRSDHPDYPTSMGWFIWKRLYALLRVTWVAVQRSMSHVYLDAVSIDYLQSALSKFSTGSRPTMERALGFGIFSHPTESRLCWEHEPNQFHQQTLCSYLCQCPQDCSVQGARAPRTALRPIYHEPVRCPIQGHVNDRNRAWNQQHFLHRLPPLLRKEVELAWLGLHQPPNNLQGMAIRTICAAWSQYLPQEGFALVSTQTAMPGLCGDMAQHLSMPHHGTTHNWLPRCPACNQNCHPALLNQFPTDLYARTAHSWNGI